MTGCLQVVLPCREAVRERQSIYFRNLPFPRLLDVGAGAFTKHNLFDISVTLAQATDSTQTASLNRDKHHHACPRPHRQIRYQENWQEAIPTTVSHCHNLGSEIARLKS